MTITFKSFQSPDQMYSSLSELKKPKFILIRQRFTGDKSLQETVFLAKAPRQTLKTCFGAQMWRSIPTKHRRGSSFLRLQPRHCSQLRPKYSNCCYTLHTSSLAAPPRSCYATTGTRLESGSQVGAGGPWGAMKPLPGPSPWEPHHSSCLTPCSSKSKTSP